MLSETFAKLINKLPSKPRRMLSRHIVNTYLNKYARIHVQGQEGLREIIQPTLFVCNHLSNADGLVLQRVLRGVDPTFVAGEKLSTDAVTRIGSNAVKTTVIKPNSADKAGLKRIINLIKSGESILVFPEGTRSRTGSLIEAKRGVLLIARATGVPIVPMGIYGTEKLLPINMEGHMSREQFCDSDVFINIGDQFQMPRRESSQDRKAYEADVLETIMMRIAHLLPEAYQGVYRK